MLIIDLAARIFWFPFRPFRRYLPHSPPSSAPILKLAPPRGTNSPPVNKPDSTPVTIKPSKMYIYTGKLSWDDGSAQAKDDVAYVFFQWTKNEYGQEKLNHHKFKWEILALDGYQTLEVTMKGPKHNKNPEVFTVDRVWDSESHGGKANDIPLVWTGKVNYQDSAKDEMAIFVVPEGFGADRPVVALWQWNRFDIPKNDPNIACSMPTDKPPPREGVKFTFKADYEVSASWSQRSGKLALRLKEPGSKVSQELGELSLSGRFDRNSLVPQPQTSLPRITGKMPFPETLVETLAHTAAFVDQAGYLAKYAEDSKSDGLEKSVKQKEAELEAEKKKLEELNKTLTDTQDAATKKETELQKKIDDALEALGKASTHDKADHAAYEALKKKIEAERHTLNARISSLQKQLNDAKTQLTGGNLCSRLVVYNKENEDLRKNVRDLEAYKRNADITLEEVRDALTAVEQQLEKEKKRYKHLEKKYVIEQKEKKDAAIAQKEAN
ncbi:hypothetical protein CSAL01_04926 [Colletotrichum salicis]|uniref:Uncharacterized protein n=1 Tax=Colletotrichum salicis TaxID=1209931 RepID=A0A135RPW9_9PEZI|nr:hypothetical protein CSAL01_04926 [Colletotrichum salicis]